ncbi:MAG: 30S ribosomal protein S4 [Nitrososphaerales archaeon]
MGDPKRSKNKFRKPRRPWSSDQLTQELQILGTYGLRNKRELWKAQTELSRIRKQARALLALPHEVRHAKETELLQSLYRLGLVQEGATLDDVLNLMIENLLERRLQSIVMRKEFVKTPYQARQAVVHGHIIINGRVVNIPSYIVRREEEPEVAIRVDSPYARIPPSIQEVETVGESDAAEEPVKEKVEEKAATAQS